MRVLVPTLRVLPILLVVALLGRSDRNGACVVGCPPATRPTGGDEARVAFTHPRLELGAVAPDAPRQLALPWALTGDRALRVLGLETGCACALAQGPRGVIEPGAQGDVLLDLVPGGRPGPFMLRVRLYTDAQPPWDVSTAEVVGYRTAPLVLRPNALHLGRVGPGVPLAREVEIVWNCEREVAGWAQLASGWPDTLRAECVGPAAEASLSPPAFTDRPGALLALSLHAPEGPGAFEGAVRLLAGRVELASLAYRGSVR